MTEGRVHIDRTAGDLALMKDVAEVAAQLAVDRTLLALGIDTKNPIEAQRMFSALRGVADPESVADREWTRRTRQLSQGVLGKAFMTAAGIAVLGGANAIWAGLQALLRPGH